MNLNQTCSIFFFVAAMVGCSFGSGFAAPPADRPDDFSVFYQMKTGSLPPPYYSEYTITITSSGKGEITVIPDYPSDSVPRWTESFDLDDQTLDQFYQLLITEQALTLNWQEASPPRLGGPSKLVRITANAGQIEIPPQVATAQTSTKGKITEAIKKFVPEAIWSSLKKRHLDYSRENYPTGAKN